MEGDGYLWRRSLDRERECRLSRDFTASRSVFEVRLALPLAEAVVAVNGRLFGVSLARLLIGDRELEVFPPASESSSSPNDVMNFIPPSNGEGDRDFDADFERRYCPYVGLARVA